jgi:hypothetical protein
MLMAKIILQKLNILQALQYYTLLLNRMNEVQIKINICTS